MSWRSLIVSSPARLSIKNGNLLVKQDEEVPIPIEDVGVIVLETGQATITSKLLNEIAERGIALYSCDGQHLPSGVFLSFQQHSRFLKILQTQIGLGEAFKKNCWRQIVQRKILNQAQCIGILERSGADAIRGFASSVKSGDSSNREAAAAKLYFESFMPDSNRQIENRVNAALNYGYSIIRGAVARSLASYGFTPALGIHHRNELNSFNLADDLMEPLRPLVDLWVGVNVNNEGNLDKTDRVGLVSLMQFDMLVDGERQSTTRAIDIMVGSFSTACMQNKPGMLKLPELVPLTVHQYE